MALGILIVVFSLSCLAGDEVNTSDPNLYRQDGVMNYDQKMQKVDTTTGALLVDKEAVKIPKTKSKKAQSEKPEIKSEQEQK